MRRSAPWSLLPALALLAAACGVRSGEDAEAVHRAVEVCGGARDERDCYEARLVETLERAGVGPALAMLEQIAARDATVERDGHVYTHAIGLRAYAPDRPLDEVFRQCTTLFQSGCYHGVIQARLIAAGTADVETVQSLCAPWRPEDQRWLLFQCLHGLGHGLTMFRGHDLPRALEDCDLLAAGWDRESCYGGAFMENITHATMPHHPASEAMAAAARAPNGGGADHQGHEGGGPDPGDGGARPWEPLRADDPHYPCSVVADRYKTACYGMQTSVMLRYNGWDVAEAGEHCAEAAEVWRRTCFQSLGRDVASLTPRDPDEALRQCRAVDEPWREWCYVGVAKNLVDLESSADAGFAFCGRVEESARPQCHEALGEQIWALFATEGARRAACEVAETPELRSACRMGARVER